MKKICVKDKKKRIILNNSEKILFVLKFIVKNENFFFLTRWNAWLNRTTLNLSKSSLTNRCVLSVSKKRVAYLTNFSRQVFIKLIQIGEMSGFRKSAW
jgi:ribosomal protein S14